MKPAKKTMWIALILCMCVICDQITKAIARNSLAASQPIYLMGDVFRFHYMENTGAFLGLGAKLPAPVRFWALIVFVGAVLIGMLRFIWISHEIGHVGIVGFSLVVGGGFSNLLDRILRDGAVVDFMNVGIGKVRTGVFNVADLAIMIGVGMALVRGAFARESSDKFPVG